MQSQMLEALAFLLRNIAGFFILNLLLRFYLQVLRAPFSHPIAQFVVKITNFAVLPLRRIVPSVGGYDTASLALAWLVALLMHGSLLLISSYPIAWGSPLALLAFTLLGALELLRMSLYLLFAALLAQVILAWVQPYNPLSALLGKITAPFLGPVQRRLPPLGGVDVSPLVLFLAIEMVQRFVLAAVQNALVQQMFLLA